MRDKGLDYETEDPLDVFDEENGDIGGSAWLVLALLTVLAAVALLYKLSYQTERIIP